MIVEIGLLVGLICFVGWLYIQRSRQRERERVLTLHAKK
jgi:hypothetical protein